jgi:hypothetical protein
MPAADTSNIPEVSQSFVDANNAPASAKLDAAEA